MNIFQLFGAVGLPVAMVIGAIAAWRASRKENAPEETSTTWRDTSLDDWRKERAQQAEEERAARAAESHVSTGRAEEQAAEKKHQRIGG